VFYKRQDGDIVHINEGKGNYDWNFVWWDS